MIKVGSKIWFSTPKFSGAFGDGKWRLFKAIEETGSLRSAATSLKMSYRKAWGEVKKAEEALNLSLVNRQRGGRSGGVSNLTETGRKWLKAYTKFRNETNRFLNQEYKKQFKHLY